MSLPTKVIDRLFSRMIATYGNAFMRQWGDVPETDIKTVWAHELAGYASHLGALAWALENLPERPMNVLEFRALCRRSAPTETPRLPEPAADPARVAQARAKLSSMVKPLPVVAGHKDWAKRIMARKQAGERVNATAYRMARDALGLQAE